MSKHWWRDQLVSGAKTMATILVALVLVLGTAMCVGYQADLDARPCAKMGGHYVPASLTQNEECWSADGSRRLFPKG